MDSVLNQEFEFLVVKNHFWISEIWILDIKKSWYQKIPKKYQNGAPYIGGGGVLIISFGFGIRDSAKKENACRRYVFWTPITEMIHNLNVNLASFIYWNRVMDKPQEYFYFYD